jgi:NitT/TauT family transport system permease protein
MLRGEAKLNLESTAATAGESTLARGRPRKRGKRSTFWRIRDEIPRRLELSLIVLSLALPLLIWTALYVSNTVNEIFLPSPWESAEAGYKMFAEGDLINDTRASSQRVFLGFGIGLLFAIPVGLGMGTFRSIRALFEPMIGMVRYAPATAFIFLLLIWLGIGEEPKVALVVLGTVFFNTVMISNVVWSVPSELIKASQTLGASSFGVFRRVIFPYAVPGMIDTFRVNLAAAWNLIVVAEVLAADEGLGFRIVRAGKFLNVDQIFVAIVVIGLIGVSTDIGLRILRDRIAPWSQE